MGASALAGLNLEIGEGTGGSVPSLEKLDRHTSNLRGNDLVAAASAGQRGIGVVDFVWHSGGEGGSGIETKVDRLEAARERWEAGS